MGGAMLKWEVYLNQVAKEAEPLEAAVSKRLHRAFDDEQAKRAYMLTPSSGKNAGVGVHSRRRRAERRRAEGDGWTGPSRAALRRPAQAGGWDGAIESVSGVATETPAERLERRLAARVEKRRAAQDAANNGGGGDDEARASPRAARKLARGRTK